MVGLGQADAWGRKGVLRGGGREDEGRAWVVSTCTNYYFFL